jgi:DNA-binding transcriptional MerR regulator
VRTLKTSEAAALLSVSPNTLREWERRFGYPKPLRSPGKHRHYTEAEITELREALSRGLSISSAVSVAREALKADPQTLLSALTAFAAEDADRAMEASLALRSMERTVEEVLLPSLEHLREQKGVDSANWAFGVRWAREWLERARRMSPPRPARAAVLIGDATQPQLDPAAVYLGALELFCQRAGASVFTLSVEAQSSIRDAVQALRPDAVVLAGDHIGDEATSRWAYSTRTATGAVPFTLYRRAVANHVGARSPALPQSPSKAQSALFAAIARSREPHGHGKHFAQVGQARATFSARPARNSEPPD